MARHWAYGDRVLWRGLDRDVRPGEFLAVVGPNGSGKTSLLRVLLGRQQLSEGALTVLGHAPRRGGRHIGYVPQQTFRPAHALLRARDPVRWPSSPRRYVTAVGGTSLKKDSSTRGYSESVWGMSAGGEGAGSGCSKYDAKPSWHN
ncbi:ATP-binding cassette domain-containing protein [Streptomyces sp. NPDC015125]|uniref:ATP-binding cassette domain-containing protein n=1 Tax=Streptomyces sp. NPDC015125 TaxID=3364938 RepID=UPI0036F55B79